MSGKVKMLKPFPEIYNYTLNKYGLIANKSIFIDDRISNDDGAIKCGIHGIQFVSPKKLIIALKKLKIELVLNVNSNEDRFIKSGLHLIKDEHENFQGPLAGIYY